MNTKLNYKEARAALVELMKNPTIKAKVKTMGNWTQFSTEKLNSTLDYFKTAKKESAKVDKPAIKKTSCCKNKITAQQILIQKAASYFLKGADLLKRASSF